MGKKKKSKTISDLFLDRPTSHGGWPDGHSGGYTDNKTPVNQQLAKFFQDMGLIDDDNPRARISEGIKVKLSKEHIKKYVSLKESLNVKPSAMVSQEKSEEIANGSKNALSGVDPVYNNLKEKYGISDTIVDHLKPRIAATPTLGQTSNASYKNAIFYDVRTDTTPNLNSTIIFNKIPYSDNAGKLGEEIVGNYAYGYNSYLNLGNSYSADVPITGLPPSSFPGVDLWLSKTGKNFINIDANDGILNFYSDRGIFASVKTSGFGAKSGYEATQRTSLDTRAGQLRTCYSIFCVWLLKRKMLDNTDLADIRKSLPFTERAIESRFKSLMSANNITEIRFPLAAYNLSGMSPDEVTSSFSDDKNVSFMAVISSMGLQPSASIAKITLDGFVEASGLLSGANTYNVKETILLGDNLDPNQDLRFEFNGIVNDGLKNIKGTLYRATSQKGGKTVPSVFALDTVNIPTRFNLSGIRQEVLTEDEINELYPKAFDIINDLQNSILNLLRDNDFLEISNSDSSLALYAKTSYEALSAYIYLIRVFKELHGGSNQLDPSISIDPDAYQVEDIILIFDGQDEAKEEVLLYNDNIATLLNNNPSASLILQGLGVNIQNPYNYQEFSKAQGLGFLLGSNDVDKFAENLKTYIKRRNLSPGQIDYNNKNTHLNALYEFFDSINEIHSYVEYVLEAKNIDRNSIQITSSDIKQLKSTATPISGLRNQGQSVVDSSNIIYDFFLTTIDNLKNKMNDPAGASIYLSELKKEIQLALICFRFLSPKPPGLEGSQYTDLLGVLNERKSFFNLEPEVNESKIKNQIEIVFKRLNLIASILREEKTEDVDDTNKDNFGNELPTPRNLDTQDTEAGIELQNESKIYKKVVHRILLESFYKKRGLR